MNFDSLDWAAEAKRVAWAFGFGGECRWDIEIKGRLLVANDSAREIAIALPSGDYLMVFYSPDRRVFQLLTYVGVSNESARICLHWDGQIKYRDWTCDADRLALARALFKLGLLTAEIESSFQLSISAHEKMEWELAAKPL